MTSTMKLIDVNGVSHELTEAQVRRMIMIGWLTFLAAWVMNILFYKTHPSAMDFSPKRQNVHLHFWEEIQPHLQSRQLLGLHNMQ